MVATAGWHLRVASSIASSALPTTPYKKCHRQGSPNRWEPGRFDRFPVQPVQPDSKIDREPVPNRT
jgi:hypothetical protein